ncbi:ABC transporter substrate-binding protein [Microbacterium lushaniae]|uniref:Sugar ABC transporter substrate-binding protein n=1 Tax=Microbacterium lushaniae TaxID=2614639 RepID=A0A5J6L734_9MICO|nr:sugar ABC transporter substrate-binding protein [Microbacterium lushaniae]QEW04324.1 sugar ABC transporter substrate-binding protein [Microbacterium lushaniae]
MNQLNKRRRITGPVAAATGLMFVLTACGGSGETGESADADALTIAISSSPSADALQSIAKDFEAETGVAIEFVDIPYDQLASQVLLGARQSGQGFDIVQYDSPMLAALAEAGALADISDRIDSSSEYDAADFSEQVNEYGQYGGKSFGVPLSTEPYVLWYRSDLFEELGLTPEPNWETYTANARALEASGIDGNGSGFGAQIGGYYWLESIYLHGGALLDPETCSPTLDSPEALAATEAYLGLLDTTPASVVNGGGNEMTAAFAQDQVAQQINATGYWSTINDSAESSVAGKGAMAIPPMTEDGSTLMFGWLIGVGEQSAAKDTAWEFLEFALGKDGTRRLIEEGAPPPARQSLLDDPAVLDELPYLPTLIEASERGGHLPYITQMPEIITALSVSLNEAASDETSANELVASAQAQVESIVAGLTECG